MASKRSRRVRSSSSSTTAVFSGLDIRVPVSHPPLKTPKNDDNSNSNSNSNSNFSISVGDFDRVDRRWSELREFGGFLENCFYCRKNFGDFDEVFMYSNLQAFCSVDCRKKHIDMDVDLKTVAATPKMKPGKRKS